MEEEQGKGGGGGGGGRGSGSLLRVHLAESYKGPLQRGLGGKTQRRRGRRGTLGEEYEDVQPGEKEQQSQTFMAEPTQKPFSVLFAKLHALPRKEQLFTHLLFLILKRASRMEDRGCVEPPCPRATRSER